MDRAFVLGVAHMFLNYLTRSLVLVHWLLTRGAAFAAVFYMAWYQPAIFNAITQPIEHFFRAVLKYLQVTFHVPELFRLAIIDRQPEYMILFILVLAAMYYLFGWLLAPLKDGIGIINRTARMITLQIAAFVALYASAWFFPSLFAVFFDQALVLGDWLRDSLDSFGSSLNMERAKMVLNAVKPYSIIALILMAIVLKGGWELAKLPFKYWPQRPQKTSPTVNKGTESATTAATAGEAGEVA